MAKRPTPEMDYERDASIKATRVYVWLEGHPYAAELRFLDDGRFELYLADREKMVLALGKGIARGLDAIVREEAERA